MKTDLRPCFTLIFTNLTPRRGRRGGGTQIMFNGVCSPKSESPTHIEVYGFFSLRNRLIRLVFFPEIFENRDPILRVLFCFVLFCFVLFVCLFVCFFFFSPQKQQICNIFQTSIWSQSHLWRLKWNDCEAMQVVYHCQRGCLSFTYKQTKIQIFKLYANYAHEY